jgi:hypothetical protein
MVRTGVMGAWMSTVPGEVRDEIARRHPDHAEAVTAFREKCEARFNQ